MKEVSVVITSFNRPDLLVRTVESFNKFNTYPIAEFIIIEDSGNTTMHEMLKSKYPDYTLILNESNIGLVESIDKAYALIKTPYVFHSEDDYEYYHEGFIERSLAVLDSDPMLMQAWIRRGEAQDEVTEYDPNKVPSVVLGMPVLPELLHVGDIPYYVIGRSGGWHGFCFQCGLRKMEAYNKIKPYTQWSNQTDFITVREGSIGTAYDKLGYIVALLPEGYTRHIGFGRSTFGLLNH